MTPRALVALLFLSTAARAAPLDAAGMKALLEEIDERQRNAGDFKALVYLEQKEKGETDIVREALVYRRDLDDKMLILFTAPKGEAGKGYLRMEKNLWFFDPTTGKWERRTERERIAGTDSRRADFDASRLAKEYDATYEGEDKLGKFAVHKLALK